MKLEPARVAEVFVNVAGQRDAEFASGYLVRDGYVLTAEHVFRGVVESVWMRFNAGLDDEWTPAAEVVWRDGLLDIAVLRITRPLAGPPAALSAVPDVRFGVIEEPPVECHAVGFPWFKVRDDPVDPLSGGRPTTYAELEHVVGFADPIGGRTSGTIAFNVSAQGPPPRPGGRSPWQGMSGAAVFSRDDGMLVGVITANYAAEGSGRLTATNVEHWYSKLKDDDLPLLGELIGLPRDRGGLSPAGPALPAPGHGEEFSPQVLAAATKSYLAWVEEVSSGLKVTGLKASHRAMTIDLERVYVGLKVDFSSQEEREAARENRLRALREDPAASEPSLDDGPDDSFQLAPESNEADYWGALAGQTISAPADRALTIGDLYRRSNASVILGDPGSGKTTIARWLALQHARAMIANDPVVRVATDTVDVAAARDGGQINLGPALLPILVRVAEYAAHRRLWQPGEVPRTLLTFLGQHFFDGSQPTWLTDVGSRYRAKTGIPAEIIAEICYTALREGRALVILDGLDEVPRSERGDVADALAEFIRTWISHRPSGDASPGGNTVKIIATSRIAGYRDAPLPASLTQVTIQPMSGDAVDAFLRNRITEVLGGLAGQRHAAGQQHETVTSPDPGDAAQRLIALLHSDQNAYARAMAANPLLASAIVNVFIDQRQDLPRQRVELLDSAVSVLAAVWRERSSGTYRQETEDDILAALPAVAAYIHDTEPTGVIEASEFERELLGELRRMRGLPGDRPDPALPRAVRALIEIMNEELGLLVASGPERYRFAHRSFQEYLAARHLIADPGQSASRVLGRLGDPQWREPVLLAIGLMNWRHQNKMAHFTASLLAQDGPLGRFFPETALLLAAAITQMTGVPPDVVRQTARQLLASFTAAFRERRLPRVRDLLAAALATLRAEHAREIDGVLIAALQRPPGADPIAACAAAQVIRDIGAATPQLADALAAAAVTWDSAEFGAPIAEALGLLVSPASIPETGEPRPRLPAAAWTGDRLAMRDRLIADSGLVAGIRRNPRLLALILAIYGGCWNLDTPAAVDSYERFSGFLRLDELARQEFGAYVGPRYRTVRFGDHDPVLAMMHAHLSGRKAATRRFATVPVFDPTAITRDSPLTRDLIEQIEREDPELAGLSMRLRASLADGAGGPQWRADILVALWALGDPAGAEAMARNPADPAAALAARRISGLLPGLADAAIRAAPLAGQALAGAAHRLPAADWELLGAALTKILLHAGAAPVSLFAQRHQVPSWLLPRVLTEEIAQRAGGCGDDPRGDAEQFVAEAELEDFPPGLLFDALCAQGSAWSNSYQRFASWWPCDPLAFPPDEDDDIPLAVFDQIAALPASATLLFGWFTDRMAAALGQDDPAGLFEDGVIMAARLSVSDPDMKQKLVELHLGMLSRIDEAFSGALGQAARGGMLRQEALQLPDPWRSARGLLRIAELFPEERPAALADATWVADQVQVYDPARAFQLRERIALLGPVAERPGQLVRCYALALRIADPANSARALLRITRLAGRSKIEDLVAAAAIRISRIDSRAGQLELLRICHEMFADRPGCLAHVAGVLHAIGASGQERAHVAGRWGDAVTWHLPALCGSDEALIQALVPVALYAQAVDLIHTGRPEQLAAAWRGLRTEVSPEAVSRLLEAQAEPFIQCTGPAARALDESLAHGDSHWLEPVLSRLVRVGHDAEPTVRAWLEHRLPPVRRTAALLLAERHAVTADTAGLVGGLLSADDDLLRSRAIARVAPGPNCVQMSVSTMGPQAVTLLARDDPDAAPGIMTVTGWHRDRLLHDDPQALAAWCDAVEQDGGDPAADRIVSGISWLTTPAWRLLLNRLRDGRPVLQASILHAVAWMLFRGTDGGGDFQHPQGALRIDADRWSQLHAVLAAMDPEPLRAVKLLPIGISQVLDAVDSVLPGLGPVLDGDSGWHASRALHDACVTSFGAILAAPEESEIRRGLYCIAEAQATTIYAASQDVQLVRQRRLGPDRVEGPWTGLLTTWATQLLRRPGTGGVDAAELGAVLEALAAAAQVEPESFHQHADAAELSQRLADTGRRNRGYRARAAAATLLGALRHGSPEVFQALRSMLHDSAVEVRQAAMEAILRLRRFDRRLIRDLTGALSGESVTVAWASAQLLGAIGSNTETPKDTRDAIIAALAAATEDPGSRQQVHFAYAETAMPEMPELDDVFTIALRRVYRLG